jgi:hypothetical protein
MNERLEDGRLVGLPRAELEQLLAAAANRGARQALNEIGLDNGEAREDIRELRSLLQALRLARRTAWQTTVRVLTTVFLAALLAWAGVKLRLLGVDP